MTEVPTDDEQARTPAAEPLFRVIVPAYGRPRFLAEAVASILGQSIGDLECIVVDDASPDHVERPSDDPRLRLIRRETNGGPAAARNTGLQHARGRYVAFCDDDDLYAPDRLAMGIEGLERAPIAVCWLEPVGKGVTSKLGRGYRKGENRILEGEVHDIILDRLPPHLGQVTLRRESMLAFAEPFSPAEDIEWWIRATEVMRVATVPRTGYRLRRHDLPRQNFRHEIRVRTNRMILETHADYFAAHPRAAARRWRLQARFAERMGDRDLAKRALKTSIRLEPRPSTLYRLGRSLVPGLTIGA